MPHCEYHLLFTDVINKIKCMKENILSTVDLHLIKATLCHNIVNSMNLLFSLSQHVFQILCSTD